MGQFTQNGVVYEEMPSGKVRVVGYANPLAGATPVGGADPMIPLDVQGKGLTNQRTAQDIANNPVQIENTRTNIAQGQNSIAQSKIGNVQELRKEFNALPEVKSYSEYLTQMSKAIRAPNTPQGDLNVIYAYAKAMDPGSVVREGEMDMANSTSSLVQDIVRRYGKITEGNRLPPEVRQGLVEGIRSAGHGFADSYAQRYRQYRDQAQALGADPKQVVGNHLGDAFRQIEENYIKAHGGKAEGAAPSISFDPNGNAILQDRGGGNLSMDTGLLGFKGGLHQEARPGFGGANAQINAMLKAGRPIEEIAAFSQSRGASPQETADLVRQAQAVKQWQAGEGRGYRGDFNIDVERVQVPNSSFQNFINSDVGTGAAMGANALSGGIGGLLAGKTDEIRAAHDAHPYSAFAGDVGGAIGGTLGLNKALGFLKPLAARPLTRMALADVGYGGTFGATQNPENPVEGGFWGAGSALAGNLVGRGAAPILRGGGDKLGFGAPPLPAGEGMIASQALKADPNEVLARLNEASQLGMPLTLADAAPQLRSLGGSVVRKSPDAYANAQSAIGSRNGGQAERALGLIDRHLTPAGDINAIKNAEITAAREAAAPLYESSYANVVPQTPQLSALLNTPAGRGALARARTIAANEGRDPMEMGFALDANGDVVLRPVNMGALERQGAARNAVRDAENAHRRAKRGGDVDRAYADLLRARAELKSADAALSSAPSPETAQTAPTYSTQTLDYVKRGLDDTLEQYRDPVTREMRLDEAGRAIQGVRQSLLQEVDRLNPDYAAARSAYQERASRATDADRGYRATSPRILPETVAGVTGNMAPENLAMYRQGFASSLADTIENARLSANPYERVFGSPAQQSKMHTLFPQGAPNFARARGIEAEMSATNKELFGGSPTQPRAEMDKQFDAGGLMDFAQDAAALASGTPPINVMRSKLFAGRGLFKSLDERLKFGSANTAKQRADQMAPVLFNPDPAAVSDQLAEMIRRQALRDAYVQRTGMFGAGLGAPVAIGISNR